MAGITQKSCVASIELFPILLIHLAFFVFSRSLMARELADICFFFLFYFTGSSLDASSACVQCAYFPVSISFSANKFAYLFLIVTVQRSLKN